MKLTAYGRTVLATVSRTTANPDGRQLRTEVCLLSDGVIGIKHSWLKPDGKLDHTAGWKSYKKLSAAAKAQLGQGQPVIDRWVARYVAAGFESKN